MGKKKKKPNVIGAVLSVDDDDLAAETIAWKGSSCLTKEFDKFKQLVLDNQKVKVFDRPICEALLDQKYFNGIGNYLRSTILYYLDVNPFDTAREVIKSHPQILDMCRDIPMKAYELNGGQLRDWKNPFDTEYDKFIDWVFYQKGISCKDKTGRTFWYNEKWKDNCPY